MLKKSKQKNNIYEYWDIDEATMIIALPFASNFNILHITMFLWLFLHL